MCFLLTIPCFTNEIYRIFLFAKTCRVGSPCRKWVPSSNSHDNPAVYLYLWSDSHIAWRIAPLYRLQDHAACNSHAAIHHYYVLRGTKRDEQLLVYGSTDGSTEDRVLTHRELDRHFSIGLINKKTEFGIPWCGLGWGPLLYTVETTAP
jgi:hypothetical protein